MQTDILSRMQLQFEIEQLYYAEASMLDERRYDEMKRLASSTLQHPYPPQATSKGSL